MTDDTLMTEVPDRNLALELVRVTEAAAMAVTGITQVEASAGYGARRMHIAAINGFAGGYGRTSRSFSAVAFTGEGTGMERDWAAESRTVDRFCGWFERCDQSTRVRVFWLGSWSNLEGSYCPDAWGVGEPY